MRLRDFNLDDDFPAQRGIPGRAAGGMGFPGKEDHEAARLQIESQAFFRGAMAEILCRIQGL